MCLALFELLLVLAGDVEQNPGSMSKAEADAFAATLDRISKLEDTVKAMLADFKSSQEGQAAALETVCKHVANENALHDDLKHVKEHAAAMKEITTKNKDSNIGDNYPVSTGCRF